MEYAEFEEKEFERPLYTQLENGSTLNVWSPGQCFEAYIGIDYAGNILSHEFWGRFGGYIPRGAILNDYSMGYIWKMMKKRKMLPNFSLNLFIQAKRPYVLDGKKEDSVYKGRYYSFKINQRQQRILEKLNHKLHNRALLVYAAPAFETRKELYQYTQNGNIISQTSFPKVSDLSGHSHWYYRDAYEGIAYSEPSSKHTENIFRLIESFVSESQYRYSESQYNFLEDERGFTFMMTRNLEVLSDIIMEVLNESSNEDVQAQFFISQVEDLEMKYEHAHRRYFIDPEFYMAELCYMKVNLFCEVYNLKWFTLT